MFVYFIFFFLFFFFENCIWEVTNNSKSQTRVAPIFCCFREGRWWYAGSHMSWGMSGHVGQKFLFCVGACYMSGCAAVSWAWTNFNINSLIWDLYTYITVAQVLMSDMGMCPAQVSNSTDSWNISVVLVQKNVLQTSNVTLSIHVRVRGFDMDTCDKLKCSSSIAWAACIF